MTTIFFYSHTAVILPSCITMSIEYRCNAMVLIIGTIIDSAADTVIHTIMDTVVHTIMDIIMGILGRPLLVSVGISHGDSYGVVCCIGILVIIIISYGVVCWHWPI